jgi:hypothetical protein
MYEQIVGQLRILGSNKIAPIAMDSCFGNNTTRVSELAYETFPTTPYIIIFSDKVTYAIEFLNMITKNAAIPQFTTDTFLLAAKEERMMSVYGDELRHHLPVDEQMRNRGLGVISSSRVPLLHKVSILCCSCDSLSDHSPLLSGASGIFSIVRSTNENHQIPRSMQGLLENLRPVYSKLRLIILTDSVDPFSLRPVPQIVWALSRLFRTPEAPLIHICGLEGFGLEVVEKDILSLPLRAVLQCVVQIGNDAKRVRCHAAIVSYLKSQLPVFNRESKQAELATNIFQLIPTIANKYGIPLQDFNTLRIDQSSLSNLDFSRVKKIRDFSPISEVIDKDVPNVLSVIPHTEADLMELGWCTTRGGLAPSLPVQGESPNIALYVDDFNAMNPVDGTLVGDEKLKSHLSSVAGPNVPSRTLHRIWRLADKDADGRLSLPEYAVCRDLIEFAKQGNEIPKTL